MEKTGKEPRGYYVEKGSFFAHAAVMVLVLSMAARLLGTMNLWGDMTQLIIHVLLPVGSSLLFILFILLLGRIALWTTILPVLGGAAFFILSEFEKDASWPLFICIALAFLAAFLYTATLSGLIRGKWLLALAFLLIFAYQVYCAIPVFQGTEKTLSFVDGMTQISSLGLVFAMVCASLALRRRKAPKAEPELPKIKDPVVIAPQDVPAGTAEAPAAAEAIEESDVYEPQPVAESFDADIPADEPSAFAPEENDRN